MRRARRIGRRDAVEAVVELVEVRVGVPGLVEVQHLDGVPQALLDGVDVVAKAVVGGVGYHHQPHLAAGLLGERAGGDLLLDRGRRELVARDRADDAQAVARGQQVDRRRAGHDQRMQDRLVTIAVAQHQVAASYHAVPDDLVRGRGAADHEQRLVGAEDAGRVALPGGDRPGVVEQRAERTDRHRNVRAQRVLTEELVEELPDRALAKAHPAAVPRGMPRVARLKRVVHQRLEHRRGEPLEIELRRARDGAGDELRRVLEQAHEGVGVLQYSGGHHLGGALVAEEIDRYAVVAAAFGGQYFFEDLPLPRGSLGAVYRDKPARFGVEDVDQSPRVFVAEPRHHAKAFLLDRCSKLPHAAPGSALGFVVFIDDRDGKRLLELHGFLRRVLEFELPGKLDAHIVRRVGVELLELAPEQLGARQHVLDRGPEQIGRSIVALLERIAELPGCVPLTM